MEVDHQSVNVCKEGDAGALLALHELSAAAAADSPLPAAGSGDVIDMMCRFVQAASHANQCPCVCSVLLSRCPPC